jgi:hypothetical protein
MNPLPPGSPLGTFVTGGMPQQYVALEKLTLTGRSADMGKVLLTACGKVTYAAPNTRRRRQAAARSAPH